jgi:hypothetical protein
VEHLATIHLQNSGGRPKKNVKMKQERSWPRFGGCGGGAGGRMKVVAAVALLLLSYGSPLVFFLFLFFSISCIFVVVDGGSR